MWVLPKGSPKASGAVDGPYKEVGKVPGVGKRRSPAASFVRPLLGRPLFGSQQVRRYTTGSAPTGVLSQLWNRLFREVERTAHTDPHSWLIIAEHHFDASLPYSR